MPLLHCSNCHHEWEFIGDDWEHDYCDWCGSTPYKIANKADIEKMENMLTKQKDEWDEILERMGDTPDGIH